MDRALHFPRNKNAPKRRPFQLICASCAHMGPMMEFYAKKVIKCPTCGSRGHYIAVFIEEFVNG